jgi:uncharacterized membrane protein YhfC
MIIVLFVVTFLVVIALPIVVAQRFQVVYKPGWGLFGIGAATFIGSQVLHIPFNLLVQQSGILPEETAVFTNLLIVALFLGASAGLFEEGTRYLTYRFWAKEARSWRQGVMMGLGHGGIEAILLVGLGGLINVLVFAAWQNGGMQSIVPPEQAELMQAQVDALFATPWYIVPMGLVERVIAILFHVAASLLVMQVLVRNQWRYWFAAFGLHTALNATAVILVQLLSERFGENSALLIEAALALFAIFSIWIILKLRDTEEEQSNASPEIEPMPLNRVATTAEAVEKSKFS